MSRQRPRMANIQTRKPPRILWTWHESNFIFTRPIGHVAQAKNNSTSHQTTWLKQQWWTKASISTRSCPRSTKQINLLNTIVVKLWHIRRKSHMENPCTGSKINWQSDKEAMSKVHNYWWKRRGHIKMRRQQDETTRQRKGCTRTKGTDDRSSTGAMAGNM